MEPDFSNMTLNEYLMYQGRHKDLERSCTSWKSVALVKNRNLVYPDSDEEDEEYCSLPPLLPCFQTPHPCATLNFVPTQGFTFQFFNQSQHTPKPPLDKEDSNLDEILDDFFIIGAENLRKMEHEIQNRCDDITDYEDSDQEDGELPDLPNFSATNEFASVCEQVEENINVNTAQELEEVQMEDVEMDEDYDIDHSNTEEALQWSPDKDPTFLVVMELDDQSSFLLNTIPSSIFNEVNREFTTPHRFSQQGNGIRGDRVCSGYAGQEFISCHYHSKYRAMLKGVSRSNSTLIFDFSFP
ncbi:hypothetical protein Tco_0179570 [Tanacetum coccineum]